MRREGTQLAWVGGGDVFQECRQRGRAVPGRPCGLMGWDGPLFHSLFLLRSWASK